MEARVAHLEADMKDVKSLSLSEVNLTEQQKEVFRYYGVPERLL